MPVSGIQAQKVDAAWQPLSVAINTFPVQEVIPGALINVYQLSYLPAGVIVNGQRNKLTGFQPVVNAQVLPERIRLNME